MKNQKSQSKTGPLRAEKRKNKNYGFTLVEALVFLFIFSVIVMTFYSVFTSGMGYIIESKNRINALALANEKMEIVRNLKYEDIGIVSGIPSGTIVESEDMVSSGKTFHIKTIAQYVDDSFDGLFPADPVPNDYKRVKVTVSWEGFKGITRSVYLVSGFTPPGLEVNSGDGILAISVADGAGIGISQARIHIVNNDVSPRVDITQNTDNNGILMLPGAKQSQQGYEITVSKNDYETVSTVDPNSVDYLPHDPNASVVIGLLNPADITTDKLSDLKIQSVDYLGNAVPGLNFHIKGGREIGTDSSVIPTEIIYNLDSNASTGSDGEKDFNNHSPGRQFFLTNIGSASGKTLIGVSPISGFEAGTSTYKFSLLPDESKTVEVKFANDSENSLLVKVLNKNDDSRVADAEVKLKNENGYEKTLKTSFDGVAFFPENSDPLLPGEYQLEIASAGFADYSEAVTINQLTTKEVKLNPQ